MFRNLLSVIAASRIVRMNLPLKGDIPIQSVQMGETTILRLPLNSDTSLEGVQSMFFRNRKGHVLVKPLSRVQTSYRDFEVVKTFSELPYLGEKVWLSGWLGNSPEDFGINNFSEVELPNRTKAWLISGGNNWVISVHGRKAQRAECLRVSKQLQSLGFTNLIISHETDSRPDGLGKRRSNLGATEWSQVSDAVDYAYRSGAKTVTLYGWSLGCLFIGEFLRKTASNKQVARVIFDSPLIDFPSTIKLQANNAGFGSAFGDLILTKLRSSLLLRMFGLQRTLIPDLLHDLDIPALVFYSQMDGYVSMSRIDDFAGCNVAVKLEHFIGGRHCRLYNQDPTRYERNLSEFLSS